MEIEWEEIVGYIIGFLTWMWGKCPTTCEGWTDLVALLIVVVTFVFITMPKAWDFQKERWREK